MVGPTLVPTIGDGWAGWTAWPARHPEPLGMITEAADAHGAREGVKKSEVPWLPSS